MVNTKNQIYKKVILSILYPKIIFLHLENTKINNKNEIRLAFQRQASLATSDLGANLGLFFEAPKLPKNIQQQMLQKNIQK